MEKGTMRRYQKVAKFKEDVEHNSLLSRQTKHEPTSTQADVDTFSLPSL